MSKFNIYTESIGQFPTSILHKENLAQRKICAHKKSCKILGYLPDFK